MLHERNHFVQEAGHGRVKGDLLLDADGIVNLLFINITVTIK
jgi:hypothetical protein